MDGVPRALPLHRERFDISSFAYFLRVPSGRDVPFLVFDCRFFEAVGDGCSSPTCLSGMHARN